MEFSAIFLTLGALFLLGLAADQIGHRTRLPRVTLLLCCGLIVGQSGFDLIPEAAEEWYEFLSIAALTMVAFLLGGALTGRNLASHGRTIVAISIAVVLITIATVALGLWLIGVEPGLALILGAIATATAPAATQDVIRQSGATGGFVDTVAGIVAIDDAWGLIAFSLVLVAVGHLNGQAEADTLRLAGWEIGGALALGAAIGVPSAYLTGRLGKGEPMQTEALGVVFLCAGLALWLEVSFLIAGMTAGAIVVNFARHHARAFHEIEHIQWPFMLLFFILAGASLELEALRQVGLIGLAYIALRVVSRIAGGWIGAAVSGAPARETPWFGMALLPQAGVAVGMALVVSKTFPDYAEAVLTITIGTTVVFELLGPAAALYAIRKATGPSA